MASWALVRGRKKRGRDIYQWEGRRQGGVGLIDGTITGLCRPGTCWCCLSRLEEEQHHYSMPRQKGPAESGAKSPCTPDTTANSHSRLTATNHGNPITGVASFLPCLYFPADICKHFLLADDMPVLLNQVINRSWAGFGTTKNREDSTNIHYLI